MCHGDGESLMLDHQSAMGDDGIDVGLGMKGHHEFGIFLPGSNGLGMDHGRRWHM
jgi:hypothetical protein